MSGLSANIASKPQLNLGTYRQVPQVLPLVLDEVRINSWSPDIRAHAVNAEVAAKEYSLDFHPSIQSTLLRVICEGAGTIHTEEPVTGIPKESFTLPIVRVSASDSLPRTTVKGFTNSSLQGYEGVWPVVSLVPNDGINPAVVDHRISDWPQQRVSVDVSLDHNHRYTHVHTTSSNVSAVSILPVISCGQTVEQDKEQTASTGEGPNQQKTGRNLPAPLSRSSLRPGKHGASQGRYSCSICGLDYAQPQGLTRHQRERHKARLCMYCREFAWGRPYVFREHLAKRHPGIDPNEAIGKATRTRRSATIRKRSLPQQQISIPTNEHDSWGCAESQVHPNQLTSPSFTVANLTPIFPMSSLVYDPQPESAELEIKGMREHEDALPLELHNTDEDHAISPSTEGSQPATNVNMFTRAMRIWSHDRGQAVSGVGFTAADCPSNSAPAPAPVLVPTPPANGYGCSPVIASPMVGPSGHTYFCHSPPALAMLRSGQAPLPSFPIGLGWAESADIYPCGDWAQ